MVLEDFSVISVPKHTRRLDAHSPADLRRAADLLRSGGTVAFPTETVYGLGANAFDPEAIAGIFLAKQRPSWDPLIVHLGSLAMLPQVAILSADSDDLATRATALVQAFWPGPLTLLLPRTPGIPDAVTAGRPLVGVRLPASAIARELMLLAGIPIAAPSANRFGHTSPTTAAHVLDDLDGRIDAVLDGGPTAVGVESTVLDPCQQPMRLYRPGAVTLEQIAAVAGPTELYRPPPTTRTPESLPSPGVGLRHYAPRASLTLVADAASLLNAIATASIEVGDPHMVGVMLPDGWDHGAATHIVYWGPWDDPAILARRLFAGLRQLDAEGVAAIVCPVPPASADLSAALRDRLTKAARPR